EPQRSAEARNAAGRAGLSRRARVLVVDDNEDVRDVMVAYLEALGYQSLQAASGHDALELLTDAGGSVDVLLADYAMPGMSGADQLVPRLAVDPDQLVKLQLDGLRVAPLRVLDQKDHDQCDDRGSCVDDQLPGVRPAVKRTRDKPQNNKRDRRDRCAGPRYLLF